jgi:hypothetical protein
VFTDGMDSPLNGSAHNMSLKAVIKRAEQEDVMVYAIGLVGSTAVWWRIRPAGRIRRLRRHGGLRPRPWARG